MTGLKLFVLSLMNSAMWGSAAVLQETGVNEEEIYISLPIFVTSLMGTVGGTWMVARWLYVRERRIERVERKLDRLLSNHNLHDEG